MVLEPCSTGTRLHVVDAGANHTLPVNAVMLVEALVLDGDERVSDVLRQRGDRDNAVMHGREVGVTLAVAIEQNRRAFRLISGQPVHIRAAADAAALPREGSQQHRERSGKPEVAVGYSMKP